MNKEFIDAYDNKLIIEHNKTNIIFKSNLEDPIKYGGFCFYFNMTNIKNIIEYLEGVSKSIWKDFQPKEITSASYDYYEYYDKKYDSNGYFNISISEDAAKFMIESPDIDSPYLYKFNKKRMEGFIYELKKEMGL